MARIKIGIGLGVMLCVIVLTLIGMLFCTFRCLIAFDMATGVAVVLGLATGMLAYFASSIPQQPSVFQIGLPVTIGLVLGLLVALGFHIYLPPVPEECCGPCFIGENEHKDTFKKIIEMEAQAVIGKNMQQLELIYAPDAVVIDHYISGQAQPFKTHYSIKFRDLNFTSIIHDTITVTDEDISKSLFFTKGAFMLSDHATVEISSRGSFIRAANGIRETFNSPVGSDRWVFERKNRCCCWQLMKVEFGLEVKSSS